MALRTKSDDTKIIAAIVCLLVGMFFIWNIAARITEIYELKLDAATCEQVRTRGLAPSADCVVAAPFRQGLGATGYLLLPDGQHIQISPIAANRTNKSAEPKNGSSIRRLRRLTQISYGCTGVPQHQNGESVIQSYLLFNLRKSA